MPIGISDEHIELAGSLRRWAASGGAVEAVRAAEGNPPALSGWGARAAEMGLTSVALPESLGGGGGSVLDQAVALEAAAYAMVPGPLLSTAVAGLVLAEDEVRAGIAAGSMTIGLGLGGRLSSSGGLLSGEVTLVSDPATVTHVLLEVQDEPPRWVLVPRERVQVQPGTSVDLSRTVGSVRVDGVPSTGVVEAPVTGLQETLVTLAAAEASGIARWCLDTAVEYAGVREQFGHKIGAFQAIKHLCAEMLETSESVTAAVWDAASAFEQDDPEQRSFAAMVAGTVCLDGAVEVAKSCIQVLGGIGFTFEHDAHLYLRRAVALRSLLGGHRAWAGPLAELAATGVRRRPRVDFGGRDEQVRDEVRSEVERIAALGPGERRRALVDSGFLAPHWPRPYGLGADPVHQLVIDQELTAAGVERPDLKIGAWAVPTILAHGSDAQREQFVMPTLRGELSWCQLFSEPGAGSDLASLRTRAERAEGGWRLTGQKVWTSLAHRADWAICLARTNPDVPQHKGITYFLLDMAVPGLDIRPLREITGESMFNEVFLDEVFVPDAYVVGEVDNGWRLARTTLANERVAMAGTRLGLSVEELVRLVSDGGRGPADLDRVGAAVSVATVASLLGVRATLRSLAGQNPGAESSVAKLVGVRSRQDAAELLVELLGHEVFTGSDRAREAIHQLLLTRCLSIAGGTTQVLRNVAGERILGLPRG